MTNEKNFNNISGEYLDSDDSSITHSSMPSLESIDSDSLPQLDCGDYMFGRSRGDLFQEVAERRAENFEDQLVGRPSGGDAVTAWEDEEAPSYEWGASVPKASRWSDIFDGADVEEDDEDEETNIILYDFATNLPYQEAYTSEFKSPSERYEEKMREILDVTSVNWLRTEFRKGQSVQVIEVKGKVGKLARDLFDLSNIDWHIMTPSQAITSGLIIDYPDEGTVENWHDDTELVDDKISRFQTETVARHLNEPYPPTQVSAI